MSRMNAGGANVGVMPEIVILAVDSPAHVRDVSVLYVTVMVLKDETQAEDCPILRVWMVYPPESVGDG